MEAQLNQAYELIKDGRTDEALPLLENVIRDNRDNDDAWWLYANAINDRDAKRNALNNILRIGTNEARLEKVHFMLAQLDDPFAFPDDAKAKAIPQKSGMSTRRKIVIGVVAILGLCTCAFMFTAFSIGSKIAYVPANYDNQGSIIVGELASGAVDTEGDWDGYTFTGEAGEEIIVSLRPIDDNNDFAPFAFLYDPAGTILALSNESDVKVNRLRYTLPVTGDYTLIVRTFVGIGDGEYTISMTTNR